VQSLEKVCIQQHHEKGYKVLKISIILLALAFTVFTGNAFAWDGMSSVYLSGAETTISDPQVIYFPYGTTYAAPYELYCNVDGTYDSGYAFADIWSTADGDTHIDWDDCSSYYGVQTDGTGEQIQRGAGDRIMINSSAKIKDVSDCNSVTAYSYFSWGGK
jgi:hypothetical protein